MMIIIISHTFVQRKLNSHSPMKARPTFRTHVKCERPEMTSWCKMRNEM